jgi:hypothetical protein
MVEDAPSSRITCKKQYDEDMHVHWLRMVQACVNRCRMGKGQSALINRSSIIILRGLRCRVPKESFYRKRWRWKSFVACRALKRGWWNRRRDEIALPMIKKSSANIAPAISILRPLWALSECATNWQHFYFSFCHESQKETLEAIAMTTCSSVAGSHASII